MGPSEVGPRRVAGGPKPRGAPGTKLISALEEDAVDPIDVTSSIDPCNHAFAVPVAVRVADVRRRAPSTLAEIRPGHVHLGGVPMDRVRVHRRPRRDTTGGHASSTPAADIVTPNLDYIALARHDAVFRSVLEQCVLAVPDVTPLVWLSRFSRDARTGARDGSGPCCLAP